MKTMESSESISLAERTIELDEQGRGLASKIGIFYTDAVTGKRITFLCDPDGTYDLIHDGIKRMTQADANEQGDMTDEMFSIKKNVSKLMKVMIKGGLLAWGNQLLTILYGSKNHPKPGKKDDILDWYMDQFTMAGVAHLMKNDTVLSGTIKTETNEHIIIEVDRVGTRPVGNAGLVEAETSNSTVE